MQFTNTPMLRVDHRYSAEYTAARPSAVAIPFQFLTGIVASDPTTEDVTEKI